jgi:hypothetical protein
MKYTSIVAALSSEKLPHGTLDRITVNRVLGFVFGLAGAVAMLVIVIAGLRYTISRGDPNAVKTSKETIIYAIVGLIIAISGYSLVTFVFKEIR